MIEILYENKNNNQNEFERLGGQKSGGGDISPLSPPPGSATAYIYGTLSLVYNTDQLFTLIP